VSAIHLSLVSHTNVGKTTLARTLLGRDVGEVRDAPHVTEFADAHVLLRSADGDELTLWDTPGFGDSVRLLRRLRGNSNPLGWFLSEVWDRWRDRGFWASQQLLRHVREHSDVLLYLVNASEQPAAAAYVAAEMDLLDWVGKPVVVLLNQLGPPRDAAAEAGDLRSWSDHLARWPQVRSVLPLDAFARCWVQEGSLWAAVQAALPADRQGTMARLRAGWAAQRQAQFDAAMQALAQALAPLLLLREPLPPPAGVRGALRQAGAALGLPAAERNALQAAEARLVAQADAAIRQATNALLPLHGLAGEAGEAVAQRVALQVQARLRLPEERAAWWGAVVSGALGGLAADIAAGGLTLGGGLLAGGLLGALGGAGVAHGLNVVRGTDHSWVAFSDAALVPLLQGALLRYLAVAHFGRGRGDWVDGESPPHWADVVAAVLQPEAAALAALRDLDADATTAALQPLLARCTRGALARLYPGAAPAAANNPAP
jgi:hypothetical protein